MSEQSTSNPPTLGPADMQVDGPCPACESTTFRLHFRKKGAEYWRCEHCGLERRQPLPSLETLRSYYDASYQAGMYADFVEAEAMKEATARLRLRAIRPHARPGRWLDVGCADGMFAREVARTTGNEVEGIDLSAEAVARATARGVRAQVSTLEEMGPLGAFDTVTMFDVLEHLLDPLGAARAAAGLLAPGGTLVLSVPSLDSVSRLAMGKHWYFYIPEEHMHLFSRVSIGLLLARAGLRLRSVGSARKPMTLAYSLIQFAEYNPSLHRVLAPVARHLPRLRDLIVPLPIGEMLVIATKP